MSTPTVIQMIERSSTKRDFILSSGEAGRERVRVVRSHGHYTCMTHLTADTCEHARAAREYDADAAPTLALDDARPAGRQTSMEDYRNA